jgi:hypothetical protein
MMSPTQPKQASRKKPKIPPQILREAAKQRDATKEQLRTRGDLDSERAPPSSPRRNKGLWNEGRLESPLPSSPPLSPPPQTC